MIICLEQLDVYGKNTLIYTLILIQLGFIQSQLLQMSQIGLNSTGVLEALLHDNIALSIQMSVAKNALIYTLILIYLGFIHFYGRLEKY